MSQRPWEFEQALCAEVGTHFFYLEDKDERSADSLADYTVAKQICYQCPERIECAEWGINNEAHGLWGGLTPKERGYLRQKRGLRLDIV